MKRYIRASADDELIPTNDRAMGDAYLVFADDDKFIVLCEGGEVKINRTLRNLGMTVHEAKHISNVQADYYQRNDYDTYRINGEVTYNNDEEMQEDGFGVLVQDPYSAEYSVIVYDTKTKAENWFKKLTSNSSMNMLRNAAKASKYVHDDPTADSIDGNVFYPSPIYHPNLYVTLVNGRKDVILYGYGR